MRSSETIDMPAFGSPSLDQLRVFLAVAEAGSFSAAARRLNRRQSVISYTIAHLEEELGGLKLFDRATRRPALTEAGRTMLTEARKVAVTADGLHARARGLVAGLEAELAVAVDVMMPTCRLVAVLAAFRIVFPSVSLRLYVEALGSVSKLVLDRVCAVGASGLTLRPIDGLERRPMGMVKLIPVAAPNHPLAGSMRPLTEADLREHVQLVLTDRSDLTRGQDFGVLSPDTWRLADLGAKHALILNGLGWGNMPEAMVRDDIGAGRLVRLEWTQPSEIIYALHAVHRVDAPPGPAGRWLMDRLSGRTGMEDLSVAPDLSRDLAPP